MTEKEKRVPVTVRAVIGRINRRLKRHGQLLKLKTCRESNWERDRIGHYFLVATLTGRLIETHVDLEKLARRENAIELWEEISNQKAGE